MTISQINPNQLRQPGDDGMGPIVKIGRDRRAEAIGRLLATGAHIDRDHARRFMQYAEDHRIDLGGLWSRLDLQKRIESTVLTVPSPGRTAMVFASQPAGHGQIPSLAGLIRHATHRLIDSNVNLAQALLDPSEVLHHEAFQTAGFEDLATLSYLERPVRLARVGRLPQPQWPQGFATVPYVQAMRDELVDVLTRSYEDTLDCPGLRGHRRTEDILEGHRASGLFDPALWTILRRGDEAVGTLLLNPSADHQSIELVYLGLVKSARGLGLGVQLLRHGLQLVQRRSEQTINLAVDENNHPAVRLYEREGFKVALRRRAMIHPL